MRATSVGHLRQSLRWLDLSSELEEARKLPPGYVGPRPESLMGRAGSPGLP